MKELSLHILDITQNSIVAGATVIEISVEENEKANSLTIYIKDNGKGIPPAMLKTITDPYTTSRTTRKVGMGLPLLNDACKLAGGKMLVESFEGDGTKVIAVLEFNHIDRQPLGDIAGVISLLVSANPSIEFIYKHNVNGNQYTFDTTEVKEILEGIPINSPDVVKMLKEIIRSNLEEL